MTGNKYVDAVREAVKDEGAEVLVIGAAIEADIAELDTYEEKQLFLQDLGLEEAGVNKLIRTAYKLLNLRTYFTAGSESMDFQERDESPTDRGDYPHGFRERFYPCRSDQIRRFYCFGV